MTPCRSSCTADNAQFYARNGVPFVMGTTGGDREQMMADTQAAGVYAVIAPQMGKQVWLLVFCQVNKSHNTGWTIAGAPVSSSSDAHCYHIKVTHSLSLP